MFLTRTSKFTGYPQKRSYVAAAQQACIAAELLPEEMTG